jgi:hypothetical protein
MKIAQIYLIAAAFAAEERLRKFYNPPEIGEPPKGLTFQDKADSASFASDNDGAPCYYADSTVCSGNGLPIKGRYFNLWDRQFQGYAASWNQVFALKVSSDSTFKKTFEYSLTTSADELKTVVFDSWRAATVHITPRMALNGQDRRGRWEKYSLAAKWLDQIVQETQEKGGKAIRSDKVEIEAEVRRGDEIFVFEKVIKFLDYNKEKEIIVPTGEFALWADREGPEGRIYGCDYSSTILEFSFADFSSPYCSRYTYTYEPATTTYEYYTSNGYATATPSP